MMTQFLFHQNGVRQRRQKALSENRRKEVAKQLPSMVEMSHFASSMNEDETRGRKKLSQSRLLMLGEQHSGAERNQRRESLMNMR